jgi:uncharacterized protein (DUF58 family)
MIVPSNRLLLTAAAVALPLVTIAGMSPALAVPASFVLAACAILAAVDGAKGSQRAARFAAGTPEIFRLTKDVPASLPVTIENHGRTAIGLRAAMLMPAGVVSEKQVETIEAPPGACRLAWACTGVARGDHPLREVHLEMPSPLGFWMARSTCAVHCDLRVYPNLRDRATASLFLRTADLGVRLRRQIGKGREFENLRQYLAGDNYEDIDWKATARRGYPVVKLHRVEHAQEVYAILDASRLSGREGILENYVNTALHLALVAQKQGDRFGLATFSDRAQKFVRARSGLGHFRLCRETVHNLRAARVSPDFREIFTTLQLNLRRRALLIFFTSLDDALLAESFAREVGILARRHLVLVNVIETAQLKPLFRDQPPADLDGLYHALAGQMLRNRMRELQLELQNKGVKLALVDPERIKTQVTLQYLDVKRRQAL